MAIGGPEGVVFLVARVLFGGVLTFMGLNHFMQTEQMTEYAGYKGLPAPQASVIVSGAILVLGGLSVVAGAFAAVGAAAVAGFLLVSAVLMHDFWAVPEGDTQDEMTQFLKNLVMAGGALAFAATASQEWAYAAGVGVF